MDWTLFLHIGLARCGSTAVQIFAHENAVALLRNGLCYPSAGDLGSTWKPTHGNGIGLAKAESLEDMQAVTAVAFRTMAGLGQSKFLVSSEFFSILENSRIDLLASIARRHEFSVKIIVYLREQVDWLMSCYAQAIRKGRLSESFIDYIGNDAYSERVRYDAICQRWGDAFGLRNVVPRIYDRNLLVGGDVRRDVLQVTDTSAVGCVFADVVNNPSINALQIEALREMRLA